MRSPGPHALDRLAGPGLEPDEGTGLVPFPSGQQAHLDPTTPECALALTPGVDDAAVGDPQHAHGGVPSRARRWSGATLSVQHEAATRHSSRPVVCPERTTASTPTAIDAVPTVVYGRMSRPSVVSARSRRVPVPGVISVQFRDFLIVLRNRWRTVAACALLVLGATAAYTLTLTPTFTATARVYFSATGGETTQGQQQRGTYVITSQDLNTYVEVLRSPSVLDPLRTTLGLPPSAPVNVSASVPPTASVLDITAVDSDAGGGRADRERGRPRAGQGGPEVLPAAGQYRADRRRDDDHPRGATRAHRPPPTSGATSRSGCSPGWPSASAWPSAGTRWTPRCAPRWTSRRCPTGRCSRASRWTRTPRANPSAS